MTTADIKFACNECGQHILADSTAAGLAVDCPSCGGQLTIPIAKSLHQRHGDVLRRRDEALFSPPNQRHGGESEAELLRQQLLDAGMQQADLEAALSTRTGELEALQEECERLRIAAIHTQAELNSFHSERLTLKTELTETRNRLASTEQLLAESESHRAGMEAIARRFEADCATLQNDLSIAKQRADAAATQLAVKEQEVEAVRAELAQAVSDYSAAQAQAETLQRNLDAIEAELATAREQLVAAAATAARLGQTESELAESRRQLRAAEDGCKSLAVCCEELRKESATLQRDLRETKKGREIIQLRGRVTALENERERLTALVRQSEEDSRKIERVRADFEQTMKTLRERLEIAEKRAEEVSDARVKHDNEVLRGIVARQNSELEHRHAEIVRFKRAQLGVRLAYVLFATALVGLGALAVKLLTGV